MRKANRFFLSLTLSLAMMACCGLLMAQGTDASKLKESPKTPPPQEVKKEAWELLKPLVVERLANGMTFLIYPNHRAPVFAGVIRFDVGGKNETPGMTGIAHMFEHMAFKGTQKIGTTNWVAEKAALAKVDTAADAYDNARNKALEQKLTPEQAQAELKPYKEAFEKAQAAAGKYVVKNEFDEIYSREGGTEMNASTSSDATTYFISLPSNRLDLWARMESDRLSHPVMRQFYSERDVVMEERRMRNENNPMGQLWELAMAQAFIASPYHYPVIGYEADIRNLTAPEAYEFFRTHYTPDRAVGVLVGDLDLAKTRRILNETFGKIPARKEGRAPQRPLPEPSQQGERRLTLEISASPMLLMAWHKPNLPDADDVKAEVLMQVVTGGRSSRWFEKLVKQGRLAADISAFSAPGDSLPNLFVVYATPQGKTTVPELEKAIRAEIARLQAEPVSKEELIRAKKNLRADTIRSLQTNLGLAERLAETAQISHDPYYLERRLIQIEAVTAADLQEFARTYLVDTNLTVGTIEPPAEAAKPPQPPQGVQGPGPGFKLPEAARVPTGARALQMRRNKMQPPQPTPKAPPAQGNKK